MKTTKTIETHTYQASDRMDYTRMEVVAELVDGILSSNIFIGINRGEGYYYLNLDGLNEARMLRDLLSEVLEGEQ